MKQPILTVIFLANVVIASQCGGIPPKLSLFLAQICPDVGTTCRQLMADDIVDDMAMMGFRPIVDLDGNTHWQQA